MGFNLPDALDTELWRRKVAVHEAGHMVVAKAVGDTVTEARLLADGDRGGYITTAGTEWGGPRAWTLDKLHRWCSILVAGDVAAERWCVDTQHQHPDVLFGAGQWRSHGDADMLDEAAQVMRRRFGSAPSREQVEEIVHGHLDNEWERLVELTTELQEAGGRLGGLFTDVRV